MPPPRIAASLCWLMDFGSRDVRIGWFRSLNQGDACFTQDAWALVVTTEGPRPHNCKSSPDAPIRSSTLGPPGIYNVREDPPPTAVWGHFHSPVGVGRSPGARRRCDPA